MPRAHPQISLAIPQRHTPSAFPMHRLPTELVHYIASFLSSTYQRALAQTCHELYTILSPSLLRTIVYRHIGGLDREQGLESVGSLEVTCSDIDEDEILRHSERIPMLQQLHIKAPLAPRLRNMEAFGNAFGSQITSLYLDWLYDKPNSFPASQISQFSILTSLKLRITWGRFQPPRKSFPLGLDLSAPQLQRLSILCIGIPHRPSEVDNLTTQFFNESNFTFLELFSLTAGSDRLTKSWWGSLEYSAFRLFLERHKETLIKLTLPFWKLPERNITHTGRLDTKRAEGITLALEELDGPYDAVSVLLAFSPSVHTLRLRTTTPFREPGDQTPPTAWPNAPDLRTLHLVFDADAQKDISDLCLSYPKLEELYVDLTGSDTPLQAIVISPNPLLSPAIPPSPLATSRPSTATMASFPFNTIASSPIATSLSNWLFRATPAKSTILDQVDEHFVVPFSRLRWVSVWLPSSKSTMDHVTPVNLVRRIRTDRNASGTITDIEMYEIEDSLFTRCD